MNKKICVVTGTRAEFGLLSPLLHLIENSSKLKLQLIATGMHLSSEFGHTSKEIEKEGFRIDKKIEMLLSADTDISIIKATALGLLGFSQAFDELKPDFLLVLGDRFEIFSAATAALFMKIPIIHLNGGEATEGSVDEQLRHCITKMSHLHFVATAEYRKRVIQLGENPQSVYNVGFLGIDNIYNLPLLNRSDFEDSISFKLEKRNLLVTFHPVTLESNTAKTQFEQLLDALRSFSGNIIFTKPNADAGGRVLIELIDEFILENQARSKAFVSLGQLRYLSALKHVDAVVGNSSSGITEAPSFAIPTINIGDRQRGRVMATSVINCQPNKKSILDALNKAFSKNFRETLTTVKNPYGEPGAATRILKLLEDNDSLQDAKKQFYDL